MKNVAERYFKKLFKYDLQTYYHSLRVAEISNFIGKTLGITEIELKELYYAALLHDIGKMAIPINILKKQEPLSEKEWEIIRQHPQKAIEILHFKDLKRIEKIIPAILQHHERYDGKGYPNGLKGNEIHLYARIIVITDAFDAMTTDRVYKDKVLSPETAFEEIFLNAGTQFDYDLIRKITRSALIAKLENFLNSYYKINSFNGG